VTVPPAPHTVPAPRRSAGAIPAALLPGFVTGLTWAYLLVAILFIGAGGIALLVVGGLIVSAVLAVAASLPATVLGIPMGRAYLASLATHLLAAVLVSVAVTFGPEASGLYAAGYLWIGGAGGLIAGRRSLTPAMLVALPVLVAFGVLAHILLTGEEAFDLFAPVMFLLGIISWLVIGALAAYGPRRATA
jgi:hypothetical protein